MNKKLTYLYVALVTIVFLIRSVVFAWQYGGIEHDSGWYLGVARNLAQRGIYASYTNTIKEEGAGPFSNIHGRYSVQDKDGFSFFPAGVTVGPGYIIPEALMMKLFGYGWWQYRLWPLISYIGLIFIIFLIVYRLGGVLSLVIFQIWLWITPHLTIQFSYESYGEHVALFYLLLSFYLIFIAQKGKNQKLLYFLSGFFFSLSFLTKYLFFIAGFAFMVLAFWQFVKNPNRLKTIRLWIIWFGFLLLPIISFELYRYLFLVTRFGIESWYAINKDLIIHFQSNGSGINLANVNWNFINTKISFWNVAGITPIIAWCTTLVSPFIFLKNKSKNIKILYVLLFASFLTTVIWYILFSSFGWTRHVWLGLIVGMMLISIFLSKLWNYKKILSSAFFILLIFYLGYSSLLNKDKFEPRFILNQAVIDKWDSNRYARGLQGLPANPIISLIDQKELMYFFNQNVKSEDRIYYLGWFLVAEASPLVDKVFYSLDRYLEIGQAEGSDGGKSYLIIGPYQKGKYSLVAKDYYPKKVLQLCEDVVFENSSYTLCTLKNNLVYENRAYD